MKNKDNLYLTFLPSVVLICFLIIGSSAALAASEQSTSNKAQPTNNEFPYPRGAAPAYGYMGCESGNTCISDNATLIHFGWAYSITPQQFVDNIKKAKTDPLITLAQSMTIEDLGTGLEKYATTEETKKLLPLLRKKFQRKASDLNADDKEKYRKLLNAQGSEP